MTRTIIIEGNSVYEVDENCMLKKQKQSPEDKKTLKDMDADNKKKEK